MISEPEPDHHDFYLVGGRVEQQILPEKNLKSLCEENDEEEDIETYLIKYDCSSKSLNSIPTVNSTDSDSLCAKKQKIISATHLNSLLIDQVTTLSDEGSIATYEAQWLPEETLGEFFQKIKKPMQKKAEEPEYFLNASTITPVAIIQKTSFHETEENGNISRLTVLT